MRVFLAVVVLWAVILVAQSCKAQAQQPIDGGWWGLWTAPTSTTVTHVLRGPYRSEGICLASERNVRITAGVFQKCVELPALP